MHSDRNGLCTSIPGFDDVTDGSVDSHDNHWESGNVYPEGDMTPSPMNCGGSAPPSGCGKNSPEQTDEEEYEIVNE